MTIDEMIAVLQAAKAGKQIEWRISGSVPIGNNYWSKIDTRVNAWNFPSCEYRVKREPRVLYVNEHIGFGEIDGGRCAPDIKDLRKGSNLRPVKFIEVIE